MGDVTKNFSASEFDSHDGADYPPGWIEDRLHPLCITLERIREALGGAPCVVISGYRSPEHNEALRRHSNGVAKNSQHVQGRAADVRFVGVTPARAHEAALQLHAAGALPHMGGLGLYKGWIHVDVRPSIGGRLARWDGKGIGSEPVA